LIGQNKINAQKARTSWVRIPLLDTDDLSRHQFIALKGIFEKTFVSCAHCAQVSNL